MKNQRLKETIKKTIKEMMNGGMLNEETYCNTYGQSVQNDTCMKCAQQYGGSNCACIGDGFFGTLQNDTGTYEGWYCGSVTPGGPTLGPTLDPGVRRGTKDPKFNDPNLMNRGRLNEACVLGEMCHVGIANSNPPANKCGTNSTSTMGGCYCDTGTIHPDCGASVTPVDPRGGGGLDADRVTFKGIPPHGTGPTDPNLIKMATRNMLTQTGEGCTEDSECQSPSEPNGCCEGGVCTTCGDYMMGEERLRKYYCFTCKGGFWGGNCVHNASTLANGRPGDCPSKAECEADCTRRGDDKFGSSTDRPAGGGKISMDRMMREAATNMLNEKEKGCWVDCEYAPTGGTERIWCGNCRGNWFVSAGTKMKNCCKRRETPGSDYTE
jgi:hypothetical protein